MGGPALSGPYGGWRHIKREWQHLERMFGGVDTVRERWCHLKRGSGEVVAVERGFMEERKRNL